MKNKINKLSFLSLLGLLGIIGLLTGHKEYVGFLGFFGYLGYVRIIPDELFKKNVNNAASLGFFSGLTVTFVLIAADMLIAGANLKVMALAFGFTTALVVFSFVLVYLVYKEQRGSKVWD